MKKYEKYKDSGVQWLGMLPEHWGVSRIKNLCHAIFAGATPSTNIESYWEGDIPWIPSGCCHDCIIESAPKYISQEGFDNSSTKMIPSGTTVMAMTGATCGMLGYLSFDACANQSVAAFVENKDKADSKFLYYLLFGLRNYILSFQTGGAQGGININECSNLIVPMIPLSEQKSIASYLDQKVEKIDSAISEKELMIADLKKYRSAIITETVTKGLDKNVKMKDSGVEWIGMIPEKWEIIQLKHLLSAPLQYGANESAESDDKSYPRYIRITDIAEDGSLREETFKSLSWEKARDYMLQKGDILFARSGATVGKTYIFNEDYDACFAGYLIKARCNATLLPKFLYYYTLSNSYENWKNSVFIQATIQNIGADKYSILPTPVPPIEMQSKIVSHLDMIADSIGVIIENTKAQVEDLKSYKSALILDAISGKVDLRNWKLSADNAD